MRHISPSPQAVAAQPALSSAGIGLRTPHHDLIRSTKPPLAWLELHPENFLTDGLAAEELEDIGRSYPLSFHAVGMSLGSAAGLDHDHLAKLARLIARYNPALVSDHLSWSAAGGIHVPDLLPLPYTREALGVVAANIRQAQDVLQRRILIENPSSYFRFADADMPEAEFLAALVDETGCGVLLDINNVYVSTRNAGLDPLVELNSFLKAIPNTAIGELHLAGHATICEPGLADLRIDTHGQAICEDVWALFDVAIATLGPKPTLIEWDTDIPAFTVLAGEAANAQRRLDCCVMEAEVRHAAAG
jgi:uncharacterized protein (UPF0276 family)